MENAYSNLLNEMMKSGETDLSKSLQKFGLSKTNQGWGLTDASRTAGKNDLFSKFASDMLAKKAELGLAEAQSKEQIASQERGIQANKESQLTAQSFQRQMQEMANSFNLDMFNKEWQKKMDFYETQKKDQEKAASDSLWQNILQMGVGLGANALTGGLAGMFTKVGGEKLGFGQGALLGLSGVGQAKAQDIGMAQLLKMFPSK